MGDSEHAIRERHDAKRQRQEIDVRAFLEGCWDKASFHTAEDDGVGLDEAMRRSAPMNEALQPWCSNGQPLNTEVA